MLTELIQVLAFDVVKHVRMVTDFSELHEHVFILFLVDGVFFYTSSR